MENDNDMLKTAIADFETAVKAWDDGKPEVKVEFRLHLAQTEALISIAQSLVTLAKEAEKANEFTENHAAF